MANFKQSCEYYLRSISFGTNLSVIAEKCRNKYARGANFVYIGESHVFSPSCFVDPGRAFLTFDQIAEELRNVDIPLTSIKQTIDGYDPNKEIVWLIVSFAGNVSLFTTDI
jgi:hypothetical protein